MWRTLSDDARQAIRDLCDKHGARLYDYCRTELATGDAEQAVAGAVITAHLYADRAGDPALRRPWLYAVARAHRTVVAKPASIGSWSRPGRMSELLPEALLSLERPNRELLDLSVRHGLADAELATIFQLKPADVRAIVAQAAAGLEEWFAAIIAARARDGCPDLTARMAEWVRAPGRRARARIGRHIQSCATCRAAPRTMTAGALLRRLPIATLPGTLPNRLALAQPLPGEGPIWRADGFPVQARTLVETGPEPVPPVAGATPPAPVAGPTTATAGKPWSAAGAAAADQEHPVMRGPAEAPASDEQVQAPTGPLAAPVGDRHVPEPVGDEDLPAARDRHPALPDHQPAPPERLPAPAAHEHPPAPAVRGRHPFTPPSRTRAFRGGAYGDKLVYSTVTKGESNGATSEGAIIRYGGITLSGAERPPGAGEVQWQEFWRERPDDDDDIEAGAPIRAVARLGLIVGVGLLAAGLIWAMLNAREHPATLTKAAAQTNVLLEEPARLVGEITSKGTSAALSGMRSIPRKADLPRPAPPVARLSPAAVWLGGERTGSFALRCTGRCALTGISATEGIAVSGTRFRVDAPRTAPGCSDRVDSGRITVRWTGRTTGDGRTTAGTSTATGTLSLKVTWMIAARDDGLLLRPC